MAKNCQACADLQNDAPNLIVNGLTSTEIASLKNNTGFSPSNGNDDCTDLNNANDCLVGNLADEIDAYNVCDWKPFTKNFVNNAWTLLASIIASICGVWTNIKRLNCLVNNLYSGHTFDISEDESEGSYLVAGRGVSFLLRESAGDTGHLDYSLTYIGGALVRGLVSLRFASTDFTDRGACWNFDTDGTSPNKSAARLGNPAWLQTGDTANGNELVVEARIKQSELNGGVLWGGMGMPSNGGGYQIGVHVFYPGQYAYGQHGGCSTITGEPFASGLSRGHLVPDGWVYVQTRMSYIHDAVAETNTTPYWMQGMAFNPNNVKC